ncbi:MAG: dihydropteroate synthase [Acidimicrobiia bacterium]|nr:dihydropteroate synthase [Acidimicrobiia bacterium]MYD03867.1 dihydropteroate synthase [Acidimicrobiia bacterium]MYF26087.1 dihydropteroate synthase [Acidimicrobiia bacterium]MYH54657.1 dihydropteroate synthase [Acidimicrobiia bacterium]
MGIVNTTPDSFSDGGKYQAADKAVAHGHRMWHQGAHLIDVGGESTRPGSSPVSTKEEIGRVEKVVAELAGAGVRVSIDTSKPQVAGAAFEAGAVVLNDVSALENPAMVELCAARGVGVVLMHKQGDPQTMQVEPVYEDVVSEVKEYLRQRISAVTEGGVAHSAIVVDPGIGFGKTTAHNLALLAALPRLADLGRPILVGVSRKAFLGTLTGLPVEDRDGITSVASGLCALLGASILRVHDVPSTKAALALADAIGEEVENH